MSAAVVLVVSTRFVSHVGSPFTSGDNMAGGSHKKLTREEELLLQDFSRNVSTKSSALFYGNAFIVSAIPMCKYRRIAEKFRFMLRACLSFM